MSKPKNEYERRLRTGVALRTAREKAGLTLKDVCKRARMSVPYLSDVERGNRDIKRVKLHAVVVAMQLSIEAAVEIYREAGCLPPLIERQILNIPDLGQYDIPEAIRILQNHPKTPARRTMSGWNH